MNKMMIVLILSTVIMSSVSGLLCYQLNFAQNENRELSDDLFEVRNKLKGEQNHNLVLENQVTELQNQPIQLEHHLIEVDNEKNELEEQIRKATNKVKITEVSAHSYANMMLGMLCEVNVTIVNFGINDVENLVVTIKMNSSDFIDTDNVTIIRTSEKLVIRGLLRITPEERSAGLIVATLELNNQTIDEYTISINEASI